MGPRIIFVLVRETKSSRYSKWGLPYHDTILTGLGLPYIVLARGLVFEVAVQTGVFWFGVVTDAGSKTGGGIYPVQQSETPRRRDCYDIVGIDPVQVPGTVIRPALTPRMSFRASLT